MSRTMKRLRIQESWVGPGAAGATARSWLRGVGMVVLLAFMVPSPGSAASDWVLQALLSEDAATVEEALPELFDALYGPLDSGPWSVESVGAFFRDDVDLAAWFGEVLAKSRPEARDAVSQAFMLVLAPLFIPEWIEFAAENHRSDIPVEGRKLAPGVRRVALALATEPRTELRHDERLEAAVSLLANERPLAEETGRRIFDLYCGSPDGDCFGKLNLLYAGPDDPSLRSIEADVGKSVVESLAGLVKEKERQCGVLAEFEAETSPAVDDLSDPGLPTRRRIGSIGEELQEVLALVERLDTAPRPVLDSVFEFWSTERFPEARRILEENDWLGPEATAVASAQRERLGAGPSPRRRVGVAELCEGRL